MSEPVDPRSPAPRVAHVHSRTEWGKREIQLLALAHQMHASGIFTVLVTPGRGPLARHARQAGLRVIALEPGIRARRQLVMDLQELNLTRLVAHDSKAISLGRTLRRKLHLAQEVQTETGDDPG